MKKDMGEKIISLAEARKAKAEFGRRLESDLSSLSQYVTASGIGKVGESYCLEIRSERIIPKRIDLPAYQGNVPINYVVTGKIRPAGR